MPLKNTKIQSHTQYYYTNTIAIHTDTSYAWWHLDCITYLLYVQRERVHNDRKKETIERVAHIYFTFVCCIYFHVVSMPCRTVREKLRECYCFACLFCCAVASATGILFAFFIYLFFFCANILHMDRRCMCALDFIFDAIFVVRCCLFARCIVYLIGCANDLVWLRLLFIKCGVYNVYELFIIYFRWQMQNKHSHLCL